MANFSAQQFIRNSVNDSGYLSYPSSNPLAGGNVWNGALGGDIWNAIFQKDPNNSLIKIWNYHPNSIDTGFGSDRVRVIGNVNSIDSGFGNDSINLIGSVNSIDSGLGDDRVSLIGNVNSIDSGSGDDDVVVIGNANYVLNYQDFFSISSGDIANLILIGNLNAVEEFVTSTIMIGDLNYALSSNIVIGNLNYANRPSILTGNLNYINANAASTITGDLNYILGNESFMSSSRRRVIRSRNRDNEIEDDIELTGNLNVIDSLSGNDRLTISGTNNTVKGGRGNDILITQEGNNQNILSGGEGNDTYVIQHFKDGDMVNAVESIEDFGSTGESETIEIKDYLSSDFKFKLENDILSLRNDEDGIDIINFSEDDFSIVFEDVIVDKSNLVDFLSPFSLPFEESEQGLSPQKLLTSFLVDSSNYLSHISKFSTFLTGISVGNTKGYEVLKSIISFDNLSDLIENFDFQFGNELEEDVSDKTFAAGNFNTFDSEEGDDISFIFGNVNTFNSEEGNDISFMFGNGNTFSSFDKEGKNNDTVIVFGNENYPSGGWGDDVLVSIGDFNSITGGEGNDVTLSIGNKGYIDNNWLNDDDISIVIGNLNFVELGGGDDIIFVTGHSNTIQTVLSGGAKFGNDNITLIGNENLIEAGEGNDIFTVGGNNNIVNGGEGNDHIIAKEKLNNNTFSGGLGNDTYSFKQLTDLELASTNIINDLGAVGETETIDLSTYASNEFNFDLMDDILNIRSAENSVDIMNFSEDDFSIVFSDVTINSSNLDYFLSVWTIISGKVSNAISSFLGVDELDLEITTPGVLEFTITDNGLSSTGSLDISV